MGKTVPVARKIEVSYIFILMLCRWSYFVFYFFNFVMHVYTRPLRTLCNVSSKHRTGGFSSTARLHADDISRPSSPSLIALHPLPLLMAILLKRDDKASEKCTNWFPVLSSWMHSKIVAVGKYTSTSKQFSCQVQKVFLPMYIHPHATTTGTW